MIMATTRGADTLRDFLIENPSFGHELKNSESGRLLLAKVRIHRQKINFLLPELLKTESEREYVNILNNRVKELFGMPSTADVNRLPRHLMAASMDHYLSLKPVETLWLPRNLFMEPGYERELRKVIPAMMALSDISKVRFHLERLRELKDSTRADLVRTISYGLSQRPDIATLKAEDLPHLKISFPSINLETLRGVRCEKLF